MALFEAPTQASARVPSAAPLLEAGSYPARVVRIVDLGKQPGSEKYPTPSFKMRITFELLEEFMKEVTAEGAIVMVQDPDEDDGVMMAKNIEDKPRWFDYDFTYNADGFMGDNSHIYKFMKAVDALKVAPNLEQGIEGHEAKALKDLLGEPLFVGLVQDTTKSGKNAGKIKNKISTFATMKTKEKRAAKPLVNPTLYFDLGNPDLEVFNKLPGGDSPWAIKNVITAGLDFQGSKLHQLLGGSASGPKPGEAINGATEEEVDAAMAAEMEAQRVAREALAAQNAAGQATGQPF